MNSLAYKPVAHATHAHCTSDELVVSLNDGRVLSVPLAWFPRLVQAKAEQRAILELLGDGEGIHWPRVDEDVSVAALLEGKPSVELQCTSSTQA